MERGEAHTLRGEAHTLRGEAHTLPADPPLHRSGEGVGGGVSSDAPVGHLVSSGTKPCFTWPSSARTGRDLDLLFLVLVVFLPALLYLPGLGFYSDDWGFLAAMGEHPSGSLWQYILWMIPAADLRPGHAVYAGR